MSDPYQTPSLRGDLGLHVPLTILIVAFTIFLGGQIRNLSGQQEALRQGIQNANLVYPRLQNSEKQLRDRVAQQEPVLRQTMQIQNRYQSLLSDLLQLARDDKDAQEVVEAWKIQRNSP